MGLMWSPIDVCQQDDEEAVAAIVAALVAQ